MTETLHSPRECRVVLPGGAGLVGQNLVVRLKEKGYRDIVVLDRHGPNTEILRSLHPELTVVTVDLADPAHKEAWRHHVHEADVVVMLQAQIGSNDYQDFVRGNLASTEHVLEAMKSAPRTPYLVHISSSVVESAADDFYTNTKKAQEEMVRASGIGGPVLRPTLMFGWFDRKHLGWLSRFMRRAPVFPIPDDGRYMRQPLYVGDFCAVILSCIERRVPNGTFNISGHEKVDYVDIIRAIKRATGARTPIVHIPYRLFHGLLWVWGQFDRNPPFTTQQLQALIARDEFEVIDWPGIFGVRTTPFAEAIDETFRHPRYSQVVLEF
ncbi:MAG TPA: NAD(P)-dependent oxidoreductase [Burkholderiaceae bacterium]|nr:NAD(P)-dependent oxidoreductase [Burkholderiaceae bacterium]